MNFSEPIYSNGAVEVSPNSEYVATASQCTLIVHCTTGLDIVGSYICEDVINCFTWSPDSRLILCVVKKPGIVQIFSLDEPKRNCKLAEISVGLMSADWAPDSRHVLTTADSFIRITVWTLSENPITYFNHIKANPNNFAFSPSGRYLALLRRHEFRDRLNIIDCTKDWRCLRSLKLNTSDAIGLLWSPDGRNLVIWDECLHYHVVIYSMDGRQLLAYRAYEPGEDLLGIKSVSWSPSGQMLALGSYDQKCRILNDINWICLAALTHPVDKTIHPHLGLNPDSEFSVHRPHRVDVYQEWRSGKLGLMSIEHSTHCHQDEQSGVVYRLTQGPITVRAMRVNPKSPFPKIGIGLMAFSPDGRFLATRNDSAPHVIWIWSVDHRLSLFSLLLHSSGVTTFAWDPTSSARLALCTATDAVFMWTPQGCLVVQVPLHFNFTVNSLVWLPSGDSLLLKSDTHFSFCYLHTENCRSTHCIHPTIWKLPHLSTIQNPMKLVDSPLPTGVFGCGDQPHELDDAIGNGPKWLRQHNGRLLERTRETPEQRRSLSSCQTIPNPSRGTIPGRPASLVVPNRQPWIPTLTNHDLSAMPSSDTQ